MHPNVENTHIPRRWMLLCGLLLLVGIIMTMWIGSPRRAVAVGHFPPAAAAQRVSPSDDGADQCRQSTVDDPLANGPAPDLAEQECFNPIDAEDWSPETTDCVEPSGD